MDPGSVDDHTESYGRSGRGSADDAARWVARQFGAGSSTGPGVGARIPIDVAFVIDTTGSMSSSISAAVARSAAIIELLRVRSHDARVAIVDFRDHPISPHGSPGDWPYRIEQEFTTDLDAGIDGLRRLRTGGGADGPEAVYSGVAAALRMTWRPDAARAVVLIGDAPAHDPEPITGYTAATIGSWAAGRPAPAPAPLLVEPVSSTEAAAMQAAVDAIGGLDEQATRPGDPRFADDAGAASGADAVTPNERTVADAAGEPVGRDPASSIAATVMTAEDPPTNPPVRIFGVPVGSAARPTFEALAAASNGSVVDADPNSTGEAILTALTEASMAPLADAGGPYEVRVNDELVLNGGGSRGIATEIESYEWDLEDDGIFDLSSERAQVRARFDSVGTQTVRLRVTDSDGRTAEASATVTVTETGPPAPPRSVTLAVIDEDQVSLDVGPALDDEPLTAYLVSDDLGAPLFHLDPAEASVILPREVLGDRRQVGVVAINERGISERVLSNELELPDPTNEPGRPAPTPPGVPVEVSSGTSDRPPTVPGSGAAAATRPSRARSGTLATTGGEFRETALSGVLMLAAGAVLLGGRRAGLRRRRG